MQETVARAAPTQAPASAARVVAAPNASKPAAAPLIRRALSAKSKSPH